MLLNSQGGWLASKSSSFSQHLAQAFSTCQAYATLIQGWHHPTHLARLFPHGPSPLATDPPWGTNLTEGTTSLMH